MTDWLTTLLSVHPELLPIVILLLIALGVLDAIRQRSREVVLDNLTPDVVYPVSGLICIAQGLLGAAAAVYIFFWTKFVTPPVTPSAIATRGLMQVQIADFQLLLTLAIGIVLPVLFAVSADKKTDTAYRINSTAMIYLAVGTLMSASFVTYCALWEPELITILPNPGKTLRDKIIWWYSAVPFYIPVCAIIALVLWSGFRACWRALAR